MTPSLARITTGLTGGLVASVIAVSSAWAQDLPDWQPRNICSSDSANGQCLLFEQRAQNNVAASWSVLPQSARATCLARFIPPLEPSWRILGDCIEVEGRRAQQVGVTARKKREDEALAQLSSARAPTNQPRKPEPEEQKQSAAQNASDQKRIADEEASFMARLAEQRRADEEAASAKAAANSTRRADIERKRVEVEEASFMALLAAQRRADAARQQKALADKSKAAALKAAEAKNAAAEKAQAATEAKRAEADRRRVANEEASFMALLAAQRRAESYA